MPDRTPAGWHCVTPRIVVEDAAGLKAFLKHVFQATVEDHGEAPSLVLIGDSRLMVSRAGSREAFSGVGHPLRGSPRDGEGSLGNVWQIAATHRR